MKKKVLIEEMNSICDRLDKLCGYKDACHECIPNSKVEDSIIMFEVLKKELK